MMLIPARTPLSRNDAVNAMPQRELTRIGRLFAPLVLMPRPLLHDELRFSARKKANTPAVETAATLPVVPSPPTHNPFENRYFSLSGQLQAILGQMPKVSKTKAHQWSDEQGRTFQEYRESNTPVPPAVYHTLMKEESMQEYVDRLLRLEQYIAQQGEQFRDIPFIKHRKALDDEIAFVVDTETTDKFIGPSDRHDMKPSERANHDENHVRVVQMAWSGVGPQLRLDTKREASQLFNPGQFFGTPIKIQPGASQVHGIRDEDVADKPSLDEELGKLRRGDGTNEPAIPERAPLIMYNAKYDAPILNGAIRRAGKGNGRGQLREMDLALIIDPMILMQRLHPFVSMKKTLSKHYQILMGGELTNAHDAQADVHATLDLYKYVVKKLNKHRIPMEWGLFANAALSKAYGPEAWGELKPQEKTALITRYTSDPANQATLKRLKTKPIPLRYIDILRFQHGGTMTYDQGEVDQFYQQVASGSEFKRPPVVDYLPRFSLPLTSRGYTSGRQWNGADTFDSDLVEQVRKERHQENVAYLTQTLTPVLSPVALEGLLPKNKAKVYKQTTSQQWQQAVINQAVIPAIMAGMLPDPTDKATFKARQKAVRAEIDKQLSAAVQTTIGKAPAAASIKPVVDAWMTQLEMVQAQLGKRFFYHYRPVKSPAWLIDPAVIMSTVAARRNDAKVQERYQDQPPPVLKEVFGDNWSVLLNQHYKGKQWITVKMIQFLFALERHQGPVQPFADAVVQWWRLPERQQTVGQFKQFLTDWTQQLKPDMLNN